METEREVQREREREKDGQRHEDVGLECSHSMSTFELCVSI